jgi:hypothetical protein
VGGSTGLSRLDTVRPVPGSPTLSELLDDAALLSLEHQIHLADAVGEHGWDVDLDAPRFTFTGERPLTCTQVHLLGSAAPGPRSWLWGWANPTGYSEEVVAVGHRVRRYGEAHGIAALASAEVPFDALPGSPTEPHVVVGMMADLAKVVTGHWTSYNGPIGGGTRVAFLLDHPDFPLPAPEPERVARVMQQAVAELTLTDHRRAMSSYAARRGLGTELTEDGARLTITGPRLESSVAFDGLGRTSKMSFSLAPAG